MKLLLDTNAFFWYVQDSTRLPAVWRDEISDLSNEVFFSAVSSWEISTKRTKGKLAFSGSPQKVATKNAFAMLPIQASHCEVAAELPDHHKDPFDRLLIAQAQVEGLVIVTSDAIFKKYGVRTLRT